MNRRWFLALPFVALVAKVAGGIKRRIARRCVTVGASGCDHTSIHDACAEVTEAGGGTVYISAGTYDMSNGGRPIDGKGVVLVGAGPWRPVVKS